MNIKTKTACIATALNILFTAAKFLIWSLTGSLAVLADAWHSFGDIASSVFVLLAFLRNKPAPPPETRGEPEQRQSGSLFTTDAPVKTKPKRPQHPNEVIISLGIGVVLFIASAVIYHKGSVTTPVMLSNTVPAGLFFLFFALCSYTLSRFEERVGQTEKSIGLLADASHSKADMIAALLTGISLILHAVEINLDRPIAYLIATLVLVTAIETIMNGVFAIIHNDCSLIRRHKVQDMLAALLKPSTWHKFFATLEKHSSAGRRISLVLKETIRWGMLLIPVILLTSFLTSTIYILAPSQQAIVERFGVPRQTTDPVGPGLHFKLPWPIDRVIVMDTRRIHTIRIGSETTAAVDTPLLWTRRHGAEEPFLTADNSFVYPYVSINYIITNLYAFLFNQQYPETLIRHTASQIMTRTFLSRTFYDLTIKDRAALEQYILQSLQTKLNGFRCGVQITDIFLRDIHPPIPIAPAFENVIAAFQEKEQTINEAYGYRNGSIPDARGNAEKLVALAQAVSCKSTNEAAGKTQHQLARLTTFQKHPDILRKALYYQTMLNTFNRQKIILVDAAAGKPDLWDNASYGPVSVFESDDAVWEELTTDPTVYDSVYEEEDTL